MATVPNYENDTVRNFSNFSEVTVRNFSNFSELAEIAAEELAEEFGTDVSEWLV